MALVQPKPTYDDLQATPDDGKRYEIIDGELFATAAPLTKHQRASWNFCDFLRAAQRGGYERGYYAPFDVVFDQQNVVEPDLLFVVSERLSIVTESNVQGAPDLIVEILSPSTRKRDLGLKLQLYARFGVRFYYVVDVDRETVQPHELVQGIYRQLPLLNAADSLTCRLFPTVSMPVSGLFT